MEITVAHDQGRIPVTVLRVTGQIDTNTADQFQAAAQEAIDGGATDLLLDLTDTRYVSSAGLRALHAIYLILRDRAGENPDRVGQGIRDGTYRSPHLKLLNPSPEVMRVLNIAGFDMFIETHKDRREALASF